MDLARAGQESETDDQGLRRLFLQRRADQQADEGRRFQPSHADAGRQALLRRCQSITTAFLCDQNPKHSITKACFQAALTAAGTTLLRSKCGPPRESISRSTATSLRRSRLRQFSKKMRLS